MGSYDQSEDGYSIAEDLSAINELGQELEERRIDRLIENGGHLTDSTQYKEKDRTPTSRNTP